MTPVEMVVAHYCEDLSWIRPYAQFTTIYDKGESNLSEMIAWGAKTVTLPNVGRESHTYLYHIVHNWDNLANWTVFFQGGKPTWGYNQPKKERLRYLAQGLETGGHLCSGVSINHYVQNRNPLYYIRTGEVRGDLSQQRMRNLYTKYNPTMFNYKVSSWPLLTPVDHWGKWTDFREFRSFVDHKRFQEDNRQNFTLPEFWYRYISFRPFPATLAFAQGAQFSVQKELIKQRPLSYYQDLLELLSHNRDPYLGYYMEWLWGEVWNPTPI